MTGFKLCATTPSNTQQHATGCATSNIQQCWSVCTGLYIKFKTAKGETGRGKEDKSLFPSSIFSSHHHPIGPRASFQYPAVKFPLLALPWEAYDGGRLLCIQQIITNRTYYMYDFIYYLVRLTSSKVIIFLSLG